MELTLFFDYACPFCLKAHEILMELLPKYPEVEVNWIPCEAHPRPEQYGLHSDLCARGMYVAKDNMDDLSEYHKIMYKAALTDRVNIEDLSVIADLAGSIMDSEDFYRVMEKGAYEKQILENNRMAWETYDFQAVPSIIMKGKELRAVPGIGLSKQMLDNYLAEFV